MRGFKPVGAVFQHRAFTRYVAGNAVSLVGLWMQRIAVGWLTWELTGSGAWLGIIAFADLFPSVLIGPIAGAVADRTDRLRAMLIAQVLLAALAAVLWVLAAGGWISIYSLAALALANGTVAGFTQPVRLALVASLVPRKRIETAVAVNSIVFNLARFVGPAVAGPVILAGGVATAFLVNALSYVVFIDALRRTRRLVAPDVLPPLAGSRSLLRSVADGIRYTIGHPAIAAVLLLVTATAVGLRPLSELLPGFADRVYGGDAGTLALLGAAVGIGAVAGGLWMVGRLGPGLPLIVLASTLAAAVSALGFALTDGLWLAAAWAACFGTFVAAGGIAAQSFVQIKVDGAMRGRVLSLYGLIFRAGPAVGALAMGLASELAGLRWPLVAGVALTMWGWWWAWRRRRALMD